MPDLNDFIANNKTFSVATPTLDDFAQKHFQQPENNDVIPPGDVMGGVTLPRGFLGNLAADAQRKLGQWWEGAKTGGAEVAKAAEQYPQMSSAEVPGGAGMTPAEQAAIDYNQEAVGNFTRETIKPAAYTAGLVAPVVAAPFLAADIATVATEKGPLEAIKEFSGYNVAANAIDNPQAFGTRFYNEPLTTAAEALPAVLIGRGIYKGAKGKVVSAKGKFEAKAMRTLDDFIADVQPAERATDGLSKGEQGYVDKVMKADEITDNAPAKKSYQPVAGQIIGEQSADASIIVPGGERGGQIIVPVGYNLKPDRVPTMSEIVDARERAARTGFGSDGERIINVNPGEVVDFRPVKTLDDFIREPQRELSRAVYSVKDGVDFEGLAGDTKSRVQSLVEAYNREFPDDHLTVTDGLRPADAQYGSPTSYHKAGSAVDFVSDGLEADPAKRARLMELAKEHGFIETLDEYSDPSSGATGGHVHIGGLGEMKGEPVARGTAEPIDLSKIEADLINDESSKNYRTSGTFDFSDIAPENWYAKNGVVGVKGSPYSYEIKDPAVFEAIKNRLNSLKESTGADIETRAAEALANSDFSTAADLYERMGSPMVAEQLRRAANMARESELRGMADDSFIQQRQIVESADDALRNRQKQEQIALGTVADDTAALIKKKLEIDVAGFQHVIDKDFFRHAIDNHGDPAIEAQRGQVALTTADFAKVPQIIKNPTDIQWGRQGSIKTIVYKMRENGTTYYVEMVGRKKGKLYGKTMWKEPSAMGRAQGGNPAPSRTATSGQQSLTPDGSMSPSTSNIAEVAATVKDELRGMAQPAQARQSAGGANVEPILRQEIMRKIDDLFTKVWTGRVEGKNWLGRYNTRTEGIRLRDYGDIDTVSHEIGHFLDEARVPLADARFDAELQPMGRRTSGPDYTPEQIRKEGVAEFIRLYLTDKAAAQAAGPNFLRHFEQAIDQQPKVGAAVREIGDMMHRWYDQAPEARARSGVSIGNETPKPSILERAKDGWYEGYEKIVDDKVGLARSVKEAEAELGTKLVAEKNPHVLARAAQTGATARANLLVEGEKPNAVRHALNEHYNGAVAHDVTMKSIIDKLNRVATELDRQHPGYLKRGNFADWREALDSYLVARHQLEIQAQRPEYKGPSSQSDAAAMVQNAPRQFEALARDVYAYNDNLMRIAVDGGMVSRELYSELKAKYPNYVSMARDFAEEAAGGGLFGTGRGFANVRSVIKKLTDEGSTRTVVSPLESMARNTYITLNLVERNRVGRTFAEMANERGSGKFVEAVQGAGDANKSIFTVWIKGERKAFQTTPDVYRAIMSVNQEGANFITKLLSAPAGWLRAGATLSPDFIVKNVTRDALSAAIYSKVGFVPGIDSLKGVAKILGDEKLYYEYKASGAMMSTLTAMDRQNMAKKIEQIIKNKRNYNPLDILRAINDLGESATRIAEYANVRAKGGSVLEATIAAKDVTIDFSRAGSFGKQYNKVTAFFNAAVQGTDRLARAFREDPLQTSQRIALYITAPSVVLWMYNHDDVRYQELPRYQRDLFWVIPTGEKLTREKFNRLLASGKSKEEILAAAGPLIRIPKPFEVGILFGSGAERMLDWAYLHDKAGVREWAKSAWQGFTPNLIPTAAVPMLEWNDNYSQFMERPIIPLREQKLPAHMQYGPQTSEVSKTIGKATDTSPRKVENTIRGYTGGLGGAVLGGIDMAVGANAGRPAQKWYEQPVVRAAMIPAFRSPESVRQFYEKNQEQQGKYNELRQTGKVPVGFDPKQFGTYQATGDTMEKLGQAQRAILADKKMSPAEKRQQLDWINQMEIMYTRQALGK